MKPKIILCCGNRRTGKDTFFNLLNKFYPDQFIEYAFADELKNDLNPISQKMFGKNTLELNNEEKEILRPTLIGYGCAWREIDINHWVKVIDQKIESAKIVYAQAVATINALDEENTYHDHSIHTVKDCRFSSECDFFKDKYGDSCLVVGIEREGAPEPTDEEKKNWPDLKKRVDHWIQWPTLGENNLDELKPYVVKFYNKYFKE